MTPTGTMSSLAASHAYAVLPAEDISRARAFYGDTLGLPVEDMPGPQFMIHAGGDSRVLVYETSHTTAHNTAAVFLVDDLPATMSALSSHGVCFEEYDMPGLKTVDGIAESPSGSSAWFTDSEGNIVSLTHMH